MTGAVETVEEAPRETGRLLRDSVMRFASDGSGVLLGAVAAIVTARVLGPSDKGTLAVLIFVTVLATQCCTLGLGDAAVVWVGQGKQTVQGALSASLGPVFLASLAGAGVVLAYSVAQLPLGDHWVWASILLACATVVISTVMQLLLYLAYAQRRIVAVSVLTILVALTTTFGVVVLCVGLDLGLLGGVLASLIAAVLGLSGATWLLRRTAVTLRPRRSPAYLRETLPFGIRTQLANVLAYSTARVDLLLVYALASQAQAGFYSVALTIGTMTGFVALGVSYASFPRMSGMSVAAALEMTAQLGRAVVVVCLAFAVTLSLFVVVAIPLALGDEYAGALAPSLILLFGNVLWGGQWLLSRSLAARGDATLLFRSFSANIAVMVGVDLFLIPRFGATGAAVGSVVAPAVGYGMCLAAYRELGMGGNSFIPRPDDLRRLQQLLLRTYRAARVGLS